MKLLIKRFLWLGNFNDPGSQGSIKFTLVAKEQDEIM